MPFGDKLAHGNPEIKSIYFMLLIAPVLMRRSVFAVPSHATGLIRALLGFEPMQRAPRRLDAYVKLFTGCLLHVLTSCFGEEVRVFALRLSSKWSSPRKTTYALAKAVAFPVKSAHTAALGRCALHGVLTGAQHALHYA